MDFTVLVVIIVLAFIFDYINGFHDAANSIATIVATKVLTPLQAVLWAAFFNFVAYFISKYWVGEFKIGNTIAKSVHENYITLEVILAGIVAAIIWNLITWKKGIPSSSSHTLLGGFIGSALANAGTMSSHGVDVVNYSKVIPIFLFIFLAPMIGMFISYFITIAIMHICKRSNPKRAEKWFKKIQLLSSAMFSIGHGGNDAQKVMGIIGAAVVCYHIGIQDPAYANLENTERFNHFVNDWSWVPIISFTIIGLGTLSGGWSIIKTMGSKITKVTPIDGVAADTAGATTLFLSEHFGIPVSTTHTITGSIIGVGITKRLSAVRWRVAVKLIWAWVLTIPVSALIAAIIFYLIDFLFY